MNSNAKLALATPFALILAALAAPAIFAPANHESRPTATATEHHEEVAEPHPHGHEPVPTLPADFKYNNRIVETTPPPPTTPPVATADPAEIPGTAVNINGTVYVPCPTEDYEGPIPCFWDSEARGDGSGVSFIWEGEDEIYYTE